MSSPPQEQEGSFLFNIKINVSADNRGEALEKLLLVLNNAELSYYRIDSDDNHVTSPVASKKPVDIPANKSVPKAAPQSMDLSDRIDEYIKNKTLVRLSINKGLGIKMDIPCRFINFDLANHLLTVYHVDEKQVYSFKLNEIDDF